MTLDQESPRSITSTAAEDKTGGDEIRRRILWLVLVAVLIAVLSLAIQAFWLEPASLKVVEERLELNWPAQPLRVAVLTDLHVGSPFNGIANLRKVVDLTNAARPGIVCILGDLVIQGVRGGDFVPPEQIAAELSRLRAEFGVFAVLGNHDNWLDHDRVARALMNNGVRLLEDTAERVMVNLRPLWLSGISDLWTRPHNVAGALAVVPADGTPVIVLTHNPDIFPEIPARVTLTLAGHTHGGQVRLPLIGAPVVPSQFGQRYAAGRVVEGGRTLYVATGVGTSIIPVRFRVPPAITILTLSNISGAGARR